MGESLGKIYGESSAPATGWRQEGPLVSKDEASTPRRRRLSPAVRRFLIWAAVFALLVIVVLVLWWCVPGVFAWLGSWFIPWAQTPGFGGAAAVVAAIIAFIAARRQALQQRQAERKEQWWKRAEWALNTTLSDDPDIRTIGFQMLESLASSEYAAEHEGDVIAAATDRSIDEALENESFRVGSAVDTRDQPGDNESTTNGAADE
jgi:hypothetical protein